MSRIKEYYSPPYRCSLETGENLQIQYNGSHQSMTERLITSQSITFLSCAFSKPLKASVQITMKQAKTYMYYLQTPAEPFREAFTKEDTGR